LAFLVASDFSLAKQLSADGLGTGIPRVLHPYVRIASRTQDALLFVQPVNEKKTDLRI
jgi:hypothetical protein